MFAQTCSQNSLGDHQKSVGEVKQEPLNELTDEELPEKSFKIPSLKCNLFPVKSAMENCGWRW